MIIWSKILGTKANVREEVLMIKSNIIGTEANVRVEGQMTNIKYLHSYLSIT